MSWKIFCCWGSLIIKKCAVSWKWKVKAIIMEIRKKCYGFLFKCEGFHSTDNLSFISVKLVLTFGTSILNNPDTQTISRSFLKQFYRIVSNVKLNSLGKYSATSWFCCMVIQPIHVLLLNINVHSTTLVQCKLLISVTCHSIYFANSNIFIRFETKI